MALDQIWKQQLALVTFGNEYLAQDLSFQRWVKHPIFDQHGFLFRDLNSQHLLAQHFQIWLEGLKKQGVRRISLHSSSMLNDEQNPNANVELMPIAHFIVSHEAHKKQAWIFGKELAEWYSADNDYEPPENQKSAFKQETFWRFDLNSKLAKRAESDLQAPNWDDIESYTDNELFDSKFAAGFNDPEHADSPYYGKKLSADEISGAGALALLPTDYPADYAHRTLHRLEALQAFIHHQIQHPYHDDGSVMTPEEQLNIRHFSQKLDDLSSKFIVKTANHYKTAQLSIKVQPSPLENQTAPQSAHSFKKAAAGKTQHAPHKSDKTGVLALIIITVIICLLAYYFGL